jgi:hypothetical protein
MRSDHQSLVSKLDRNELSAREFAHATNASVTELGADDYETAGLITQTEPDWAFSADLFEIGFEVTAR